MSFKIESADNNLIPSVAVLLAAYNGEKWIQEQISTILNQEYINVHLFVNIDLSSDNTYYLVRSIQQNYDNITLLDYGLKYGSAAKNFFKILISVDFSCYDYISFSDQDDIWFPSKLFNAIKVIKSRNVDAYSSNVVAFWPDGKKLLINKSQPQCDYDYLFESAGPGCTFVFTKEFALQFKNFICHNTADVHKLYLHDWFAYAFARSNGFKWHIDSSPSILYRQHENNEIGANNSLSGMCRRIKKITSGTGLEESSRIARLLGLQKDPFVENWIKLTRFQIFKLSFSAVKCRRKRIEQMYFFFACLLLSILGVKKT